MRLPWLAPDDPLWFPSTARALAEPNGLLCAGGDLQPQRLLEAYRRGIFPWYGAGEPILWWTPQPRCVLPLQQARAPRRLLRTLAGSDWQLAADLEFERVMHECAAPRPQQRGTWITAEMQAAYCRLHQLGHAHSVEVRSAGGELIGGLYGLALGTVFFGESMFSRASQASKVALYALAGVLREWGYELLDGQVESPHLALLGFQSWSRERFEALLARAARQPAQPGSWQQRWPLRLARQLARGPATDSPALDSGSL